MQPRRILIVLVVLGLIFGAGANALALTNPVIDISSVENASLHFVGGASPYFEFTNAASGPDVGNSFKITGTKGLSGDSVGLDGTISGQFAIVTSISTFGPLEFASVNGTGVLDINDGLGFNLTANVQWYDIYSLTGGTSVTGGINYGGFLNLTNVTYGGGNSDLKTFQQDLDQMAIISFSFAADTPTRDLLYLVSAGHNTNDSYSGQLSAVYDSPFVPVPPAALLLGSGLLGLAGWRRFRKG